MQRNFRDILNVFRKFKRKKNVTNGVFKKYLLITNMGISCSLSGLGDIMLQQYSIHKSDKIKSWDVDRTKKMSITGLSVGLICHFWYKFLDKKFPGTSLKIVLKKVFLDQIIFSPAYIAVFFLTCGLLERTNWKNLKEEILEKGTDLYVAEWIVWPPAQIINFYFLPTHYRILYDSTISLGYDVYTSYIKYAVKKN